MGVINVQGTVSPLWREQVVANPGQATAITAGGGSGTNTVTVGTALVGLGPGMLVTFSAGTAETVDAQVLSYNSATGVVTFLNNLQNAHTTGNMLFGYSGVVYDGGGEASSGGFNATANGTQSPIQSGNAPGATYGAQTNQKLRVWDHQLRQSNIYT